MDGVDKSVPLIHFATSSSTLLERMKRAGGDVIGVDWRVNIGEAWARLGYDVAIQGNLDPVILLGPVDLIEKEVKEFLRVQEVGPAISSTSAMASFPTRLVDHVAALVEMVHQYSPKSPVSPFREKGVACLPVGREGFEGLDESSSPFSLWRAPFSR